MKAIDKIKKLLALSKSSNENEAAVALAQALKIAAENELDIAQIDINDDVLIKAPYSQGHQSKKIEQWKGILFNRIAHIFGCATMQRKRLHPVIWGKYIHSLVLVGRKQDVEVADYVATYLQRELMKLARKEMDTVKKRRKISDAGLRSAFMVGAVYRVIMTAKETFERAETSPIGGFELMVKRSAAAQKYVDSKCTGIVTYNETLDQKALHAGFERARDIHCHNAISSNQKTRMIGE